MEAEATTILNNSYYDYQYYSENNSKSPCDSETVSNFISVFLPLLYSLVFILGFTGNGLVVCVVLKHLHRSNLTDLCLLNLAVSDLLFLLTLPLYAHYSAVSHWVFGDFMCHISGGLHNVGFYSSTFFMVAMTLDRYVLIQHVQKASKYRSMKTGMVMTTCVWALSFCISLPAFIFTQVVIERVACEYSPEDRTWIKYNIFSTNILGLVLPVTVMVVCYSRIIPTLMKIRSTQKRRIVKLIICIVVAFFLFWAPYNITLFLDFLRFEGTLTDSCELDTNLILSTTVTETLAFSHCCLNPIIYAFAGQKFMRRSLMMLRKLLPWAPSSRHRSDGSFRMSSVMSRTSFTTSVM
ncbi:C-C chemokine receptor type 2-like [Periophthalmus magnuspinnatus]|uniref:C-C chemokine receptor type 2-like n=1 Tax=Periophthalmus magnuspinnatus TaxID=409849 RepID=UPI00145A3993|nr:C-C chemokine receptor type 2-like [Periophthalmus magnuspinnatus]